MNYVTYDFIGKLTGGYHQDLHPSHTDKYIEVTEQQRIEWVHYQANETLTGIELAPITAPNIDDIRTSKNAQINTWRALANQSTFTHLGKTIACDALSRSDIDAVAGSIALNSAFPAGFPNAWKAVDNTYLMLPDIDAFKAMYNSMTLQGTVNFGHSQDLKLALASATTIEQINLIEW